MYEISFKDQVMQQFQARLSEFGDKGARKILNMALNKSGHTAFVTVKKNLTTITGIAYNKIADSVTEQKSKPSTLTYAIVAQSGYTNLRQFKPYSGAGSFSASPWAQRHKFPNTFQPGPPRGYDSTATVYHRTGEGREIKPSFGPNVAVEMAKPAVTAEWAAKAGEVLPEIARLIKLRLEHAGPFSFTQD